MKFDIAITADFDMAMERKPRNDFLRMAKRNGWKLDVQKNVGRYEHIRISKRICESRDEKFVFTAHVDLDKRELGYEDD